MTRRELSKIYYLDKLLQSAEEELDRLESEANVKAVVNDDMPHAHNGKSDPTGDLAIKIAEQKEVVSAIIINLREQKTEVWKYIAEIQKDDFYLANIINFRCIQLKTWNDVAASIGGNATELSVKQYFGRNIKKYINES